jgi:hypothetical protein
MVDRVLAAQKLPKNLLGRIWLFHWVQLRWSVLDVLGMLYIHGGLAAAGGWIRARNQVILRYSTHISGF